MDLINTARDILHQVCLSKNTIKLRKQSLSYIKRIMEIEDNRELCPISFNGISLSKEGDVRPAKTASSPV